jgi:hypothetical protein
LKIREIELKSGGLIDYRKELELIVGNGDQERGLTVPEIRMRIQLLDEIEKSNGKLRLSEEHFTALKNLVNLARFVAPNRETLAFVDDVNAAPEVELN